MSAACPSSPPPAPRAKYLRDVSRCSDEREADKQLDALWFRDWCRAHRITERDLMTIIGASAAVARKKMTGESPVNTTDIRRFPSRYREELLHAFVAHCRALDVRGG